MSAKVVVTRRIPRAGLERVQEDCELLHWDSEDPIPRETLLEWVQGADGLYCMLTERINDEVLDAAGPNLKVVSTMSVGYDHIDVAACRRRGVAVGNTPGVLTDTTADLALALMLAAGRRLSEGIDAVRNGEWSTWKPEWLAGYDLYGSTVGIVGLGRIGAAVARRLKGFDCRLIAFDPIPNQALGASLGVEFVSFDALLAQSDFVTIHCALTPETRNLFGADAFAKMKSTAILVNTSRGGTVDHDALHQALSSGQIAAAGLDVTVPEPLPAGHKLLALKNIVVLPHIASASYATRGAMARLAADNVIAGVSGLPLPAPVS
jgi:glyoxylate/hydroxypyruvate reductase